MIGADTRAKTRQATDTPGEWVMILRHSSYPDGKMRYIADDGVKT